MMLQVVEAMKAEVIYTVDIHTDDTVGEIEGRIIPKTSVKLKTEVILKVEVTMKADVNLITEVRLKRSQRRLRST